jgi:hypothetical protein
VLKFSKVLGEKLLQISENIKCRNLGVNIALSKIGLLTLNILFSLFFLFTRKKTGNPNAAFYQDWDIALILFQ